MKGPLVPFREIVLKVHSRCDLACDHCYIYEHADHSWRNRPRAITDEAITWTALRLAEHAKSHALPSVSVILHGGEPLLAGPGRLRKVCEELTAALDGVAALDLRIHTNGLQLGPRYLELFDAFGVRVGISLDGDRAANDRHRRFADGRTSHPLVLRAVSLLREERWRHLYLGLLCTVDVANDPVAVYDALAALDPPRVDFLLPHATWDNPPVRPGGSATAHADWLLAVYDRWDAAGRPVPVRLFDSVLSTLAGGPSLTESLGLAPSDLVVVETDGTLEQVDSLKSAYDGAAATGFDVFTHPFDLVASHPGVQARQRGLDGVSAVCRRCPVVRSCGGGLYTHRYGAAHGFDHTSVYCSDLEALIRGIEHRAAPRLVPAAVTDPDALRADHRELTRTLLALLHRELDGRGGPEWERAWALALAVDTAGGPLDAVCAHPYTHTWLRRTLTALAEDRPGAVAGALGLAARLAAALVRAGDPTPVRVRYEDGALDLPGLGRLMLGGPGECGEAVVRAGDGGFSVTAAGRPDRWVPLTDGNATGDANRTVNGPAAGKVNGNATGDARAADDWWPVRAVGGRDGTPALHLDDLDPCRDCHAGPARRRLTDAEAALWDTRLTAALALLRRADPQGAAGPVAGLTTLTPLDATAPGTGPDAAADAEPRANPRPGAGPGALGIALPDTPGELAVLLLRGAARARLDALADVCDLYARDGWWRHPAPWAEGEIPVSALLAGAAERVAVVALDPRQAAVARAALDLLDQAPELSVAGRRFVAGLRADLDGRVPAPGDDGDGRSGQGGEPVPVGVPGTPAASAPAPATAPAARAPEGSGTGARGHG
ncbi:FxsB family cyclophane-forming radical SAM/SPASM peptide maturase [Streptomyces yaizuensis]|uniref:FxsB family radical SAM/SPASM domain protein n=1 Tax=Streptomyces yaizuensis TaxID=2989713 RepID=A0ABQ5P0N8_9ACTN|nr:FxsB family cyclophane-forming radical SAM/SPASM peptide maturase [Streptomyces sp. YSPA8]GLF96167.1 FxsB family radical SAM/SPASM domain protein [Streptomyces sp. YSPA8]